MAIKALTAIVHPPKSPIEKGTEKTWHKVESALKIKLPRDFQDLMLSYGSGMFTNEKGGDVIYFYNPFADHYLEFMKGEHDSLRQYRREEGKEEFEYPIFPRSPGVFLLGRSSMGYDIFYLTAGEPDHWPVVVRCVDDSTFERYDLCLSEFLAGLFGGKGPMPPWPKKWFAKRKITIEPGRLSSLDEFDVEYKSVFDLHVDAGRKTPFWFRGATDDATRAIVVKRISEKSSAPTDKPSVIVDIYDDGVRTFEDYDMGDRAEMPIFRLIPSPTFKIKP